MNKFLSTIVVLVLSLVGGYALADEESATSACVAAASKHSAAVSYRDNTLNNYYATTETRLSYMVNDPNVPIYPKLQASQYVDQAEDWLTQATNAITSGVPYLDAAWQHLNNDAYDLAQSNAETANGKFGQAISHVDSARISLDNACDILDNYGY